MTTERSNRRCIQAVLAALSLPACYSGAGDANPLLSGGGSEDADPQISGEGESSAEDGSDGSVATDGSDGIGEDTADMDSGEEPPPPPPGVSISFDGEPLHARFVRLTHDQWERSVRDLLRLPELPGLASTFVPDAPLGKFTNNERRLEMTVELTSDYGRAAEQLAVDVASDPAALARVTGGATDGPSFVRDFGLRAFRRPLEPAEQARYEVLFDSADTLTEDPDLFAGGVRLVIEGMLQSPSFVYRTELGEDGDRLSPYELATKLSLFLRDTIPDDEMLAAAADGVLDTEAGLRTEVERLMGLPDAIASMQQFHAQLFRTYRYHDIQKDPQAFPSFDAALNEHFLAADHRFFDYLYENDLGLHGLLLSTVGFVNQSTAPLYGTTAFGEALREVELADRPGYFTRMGFLALNGTLRQPDPIHRGVEVLREILCVDVAPPVGEIPPLPPEEAGVTNRERVNAHTGPGTCGAACHGTIINPIGFAFENYDSVGAWRELDNGQSVDASGTFAAGDLTLEFENGVELLNLIADTAQAHACYAKYVAEFVLARDLTEGDAAEIYALGDTSAARGSMRELVLEVVLSPSFSMHHGATSP